MSAPFSKNDLQFLKACGIVVYSGRPLGELRPVLDEQNAVMDAPRICWRFWEMAGRQSDYHRRGTPNVIDLGEIE